MAKLRSDVLGNSFIRKAHTQHDVERPLEVFDVFAVPVTPETNDIKGPNKPGVVAHTERRQILCEPFDARKHAQPADAAMLMDNRVAACGELIENFNMPADE